MNANLFAVLGCVFLAATASGQDIPSDPSPERLAVCLSLPDFRVEAVDSRECQTAIDVADIQLEARLFAANSQPRSIDTEFLKEPLSYLYTERMAALHADYEVSTAGISDGSEISTIVFHKVSSRPGFVCEIVQREVRIHPDHACEIVKAAIEAAEADDNLAVQITRTAIMASPENMRLISQCALAQAPGALTAIQALLASFDPNAGETGGSSKDSKVSIILPQAAQDDRDEANPLDLLALAISTPDPVIPPPVSAVNP